MNSNFIKKGDNYSTKIDHNEISLKDVYDFVYRNKKLFFTTLITTIFIFGVSSLIKKKTWRGDFQIVITKNRSLLGDSKSNLENQLDLAPSFLTGNTDNKTQTQLEVLKSPSVLMPIFNKIKNNTYTSTKYSKKYSFSDWLKLNLKVNLIKGSSVVNISYFSKDKSSILPVLQDISRAYKKYSYRDSSLEIERGIDYLTKQVAKYKLESANSFRESYEFAMKHELIPLGLTNNNEEKFNINNQNNNLSLTESEALIATKNIGEIKEKIIKFQEASKSEDGRKLLTLLPEINTIGESNLGNDYLSALNDLALLKRKYKENDLSILEAKKTINALFGEIKSQGLSILRGKLVNSEIKLSTSSRPKDIFVEYKLLTAKNKQDELTLNSLNNQLAILSLEKAKKKVPWELITNPTLLDSPVAPSKKIYIGFGLIIGLFAAILIPFILEKYKGLVYTKKQFLNHLDLPLISSLNFSQIKQSSNSVRLLVNKLEANENINSIAIFIMGNIDNVLISKFKEKFKKDFNQINNFKNLLITSEIEKIKDSDCVLVIGASGIFKKDDIENLSNDINMLENKLIGLVYIY